MQTHKLLIRFNHAPKNVMDIFTSLLGRNNYIMRKTSYGLVEIESRSKGAFVCLLARMRINKIDFREIKKDYSKKT